MTSRRWRTRRARRRPRAPDRQARERRWPCIANDAQIQAALAQAPVNPYTESLDAGPVHGAQTKPGDAQSGPRAEVRRPGRREMLKCRYCGALVLLGEHDWVSRRSRSSRSGAEGQRARVSTRSGADPGVAGEVSRTRVVSLLEWVEAGRANSPAPMRKCSTPGSSLGRAWEWTRARATFGRRLGRRQCVVAPGRAGSRRRAREVVGALQRSPSYTPSRR